MTLTDEAKRRRHRNERILAAVLVLVLGIAVAALIRYTRLEEQELLDQTYVPQATTLTPEVELLQQYIRIDTSNPPGNEMPAARWLASQLSRNGIRAEIIESAPNRGSVYARIKGRLPGEGLALVHHIDVVPAPEQGWIRPPFSGEIHFNQLYGRGAIDTKGLGICELAAFVDLVKAGRQPERDIVFLAVADEETGSEHGMRWLLDHRPDVIEGITYAINEGGITEMLQEEVTYYGIEIGTKQTVPVMVTAPTREQLMKVRISLEPWIVRREPDRLLPEVRRLFRDIAPQRMAFREKLADIDRTIREGNFWNLPAGYREVTQNNVWPEPIRSSGNGFEMPVLLFNLPDEIPEERVRWLAAHVARNGATIIEPVRPLGPVPSSSPDTPLFALLAREAGKAFQAPTGTEFLGRSVSDSRFLRVKGIQAYGISAFPVDFFQSQSIHAVNERVRVDYFQRGVGFVKRVVNSYAFGT